MRSDMVGCGGLQNLPLVIWTCGKVGGEVPAGTHDTALFPAARQQLQTASAKPSTQESFVSGIPELRSGFDSKPRPALQEQPRGAFDFFTVPRNGVLSHELGLAILGVTRTTVTAC